MRFITVFLILILAAAPATSRQINDAERATLKAEVSEFMQALANKNMRRVLTTIPPRLITEFARISGTAPDKFINAMVKDVRASMKDVRFSDMQISTNALDLRQGSARDGTPITFTFVPMNFHMRVQGRDFAITSSVLAISEGGKWYFMRIEEDDQKAILTKVYPVFKHVRFPAGKMVEFE